MLTEGREPLSGAERAAVQLERVELDQHPQRLQHRRPRRRLEQLLADGGGAALVLERLDRQDQPLERHAPDLGLLVRLRDVVKGVARVEVEGDARTHASRPAAPLLGVGARD